MLLRVPQFRLNPPHSDKGEITVIGSSRTQGALVACFVGFFALCLGGPAHAESGTPILQILSVEEESFGTFESPHGTSKMAPLALPGWMGGGMQRFEKGKYALKDWTYWYHEVMYVVRGRGRITASLPPYTASESYDVGSGDIFVVAPSTRISIEALSEEVFEVFYAVPE